MNQVNTIKNKEKVLESINPATLEIVGQVEKTPVEEVESVSKSARKGFLEWSSINLKTRVEVIKRAQILFMERKEAFAELITLEMGRPLPESMVLEVEATLDLLGYYSKKGKTYLKDRWQPLHNPFFWRRKSRYRMEPLGVMGIISPWNWPLLIPMGCIVPALVAGNSIVFKPSELTPLLGGRIRELFLDAGVPKGAFHVIQGSGPIGSALVKSSVDKIFFTGSTDIGRKVMRQASENLKNVVLELGGNDPAIVCEDADLEISSSGVVWGGFNNCGQNCNSIERVFVNEKISEEFIRKVIEKVSKLKIGNGAEPDVDVGPLASESQLIKIQDIIKCSIEEGCQVLLGGEKAEVKKGYFFQPTVILRNKDMPYSPDLETFGPVVYITPVKNDEEAVTLANNSSFGLAASVWTDDRKRGNRIAHQLESGTVLINDAIVSFGIPEANWTGIKDSGIGWVHGEKGLDEMVNMKYINRDPQSHTQKFWWFPYNIQMVKGMIAGMDLLYSKKIGKRLAAIWPVLKNFASYLFINRNKGGKI
jgi:acyl-CoA reductase-like NAD-dependent aldehyde dehydrogenase